MATFLYTALDRGDNYVKGKVEARSAKRAQAKLTAEGFLVINLKSEQARRFAELHQLLSSVSRLDKIFFTSHLHTLLESGIALDQAVKVTAEQTANQRFRDVLLDIYQRTQQGQSLASSLALYERYFSPFYVNLVRVAEASGKLDEVLAYLLEQQEKDYDLITRARGAMVYPSVIITALITVVVFMMVFVIPRITGFLSEYNVALPLPTRLLIAVSYVLIHYGLLILFGVILLVVGLAKLLRTPRGQWQWDAFLLKVPRLKTILRELNLARFTRAMSSLLRSGVSLDLALDMAGSVVGNSHYRAAAQSGTKLIRKGIPLAEVLKGYPELYPSITTRMVEVGEKTGKLDTMFSRLATFYERSVTNTLSNLASVIEPLLLLSIGLVVALVALAVLTPIWKFSQTI